MKIFIIHCGRFDRNHKKGLFDILMQMQRILNGIRHCFVKGFFGGLGLFWSFLAAADSSFRPALIIMDMQPSFIERTAKHKEPENLKKTEAVTQKIVDAIVMAKQKNIPIIFIELEKIRPTVKKLTKAGRGYEKIIRISKTTENIFSGLNDYKRELVEFLNAHQVNTLILTGANGGACLMDSIEGALKNNYNVIVYNDGVIDFNREQFIYPFVNSYGIYQNTQKWCKSCTFRESVSLSDIFESQKQAPLQLPGSALKQNQDFCGVPNNAANLPPITILSP